jgi:PBP1b-binding outer membrane lipoprotein LpoB
MKRSILVLAAAVLFAGCATTTTTETRKAYAETKAVNVGDEVMVTTKDGRRLEFQVTAADAKAVQGKGVSVAREDIASIKAVTTTTVTKKESTAQPAVQAVSTLGIVFGIIAIAGIIAVF